MAKTPAATRADWEQALAGLVYPVARDAVIRAARGQGGIDREVLEILERLPDPDFEDEDTLLQAVRETYNAEGYSEPPI
jgi:hypothetical protein